MRQFLLLLTLSGLLIQNFSKLIIVANFELNREYIAKNLCIKKEEVNNCCKGSCHLQKQLDADEKKQEAPKQDKLKSAYEVQFCEEFTAVSFYRNADNPIKIYTSFGSDTKSGFLGSVFHPPLV